MNKDRSINGRCFALNTDTKIRIYPNLKLGNRLRIYFSLIHSGISKSEIFIKKIGKNKKIYWKKEKIKNIFPHTKDNPEIIIGYCGDHLPTSKDK